jgi:hypothetical protein
MCGRVKKYSPNVEPIRVPSVYIEGSRKFLIFLPPPKMDNKTISILSSRKKKT